MIPLTQIRGPSISFDAGSLGAALNHFETGWGSFQSIDPSHTVLGASDKTPIKRSGKEHNVIHNESYGHFPDLWIYHSITSKLNVYVYM